MLDWLMSLFKSGPDFGNMNPDDYEAYWRADHEIDQAERESPAALKAALGKYGARSKDHWDEIKGAFHQRHSGNPDFMMAASRVNYSVQMENVADVYQMPGDYQSPVEGVSLDQLARVQAAVEQAEPGGAAAVQQACARFGLDPARYQRVLSGWQSRMGGSADAMAATMLSQQYHMYLSQARAAESRGGAA